MLSIDMMLEQFLTINVAATTANDDDGNDDVEPFLFRIQRTVLHCISFGFFNVSVYLYLHQR